MRKIMGLCTGACLLGHCSKVALGSSEHWFGSWFKSVQIRETLSRVVVFAGTNSYSPSSRFIISICMQKWWSTHQHPPTNPSVCPFCTRIDPPQQLSRKIHQSLLYKHWSDRSWNCSSANKLALLPKVGSFSSLTILIPDATMYTNESDFATNFSSTILI